MPPQKEFVIGEMAALKASALRDSQHWQWPIPTRIDVSGAQFIAAAMRSGINPPKQIQQAPEVRKLWSELGLDNVLPLDALPTTSEVPE